MASHGMSAGFPLRACALLLLVAACSAQDDACQAKGRLPNWGQLPAFDSCMLNKTWPELAKHEMECMNAAEGRRSGSCTFQFKTGGLGDLMKPHEFHNWVCVRYDTCTDEEYFCYVYDEIQSTFIPWYVQYPPCTQLSSSPPSSLLIYSLQFDTIEMQVFALAASKINRCATSVRFAPLNAWLGGAQEHQHQPHAMRRRAMLRRMARLLPAGRHIHSGRLHHPRDLIPADQPQAGVLSASRRRHQRRRLCGPPCLLDR
eukprot:664401-Rhodomonas_salina.1